MVVQGSAFIKKQDFRMDYIMLKSIFSTSKWLAIQKYEGKIAKTIKNPKDKQYATGTHFMQFYKGIGWC